MAARERMSKAGWWILPLVAAVAVALDQWTKHLVASRLELYESWAPFQALASVFTIHYVTNTGAAFGLFQNGSLFFVIVAVIVSVVIVLYYRHLEEGQWLIRHSGPAVSRLRRGRSPGWRWRRQTSRQCSSSWDLRLELDW